MPNWQAKRMRTDGSGHESSVTVNTGGAPGKWRVHAEMGGEGPLLAEVIAAAQEEVARRMKKRLEGEPFVSISGEIAKLEANQGKFQQTVSEEKATLVDLGKKRKDQSVLLEPNAGDILAGLAAQEERAKVLLSRTEEALVGVNAMLAGLRKRLRAEKDALAALVVEEMKGEVQKERARAEEVFLKGAGKGLDALVELESRLLALKQKTLVEKASAA
jgi:hypothetical protein